MNKQEYIAKLEAQNGYCSCPEIADLIDLRKKVEGLEAKCEFLDRNFGRGDETSEDERFLRDYQDSVQAFKDSASQYYLKLTDYARQGKVKIILHDIKRQAPAVEMPADRVIDLLSGLKKPVMTVHCSKCSQQIDVTD